MHRKDSNLSALENDSIVDVANEGGGVAGVGSLPAQQMQHASRQHVVFTVLDELAQMAQPCNSFQSIYCGLFIYLQPWHLDSPR